MSNEDFPHLILQLDLRRDEETTRILIWIQGISATLTERSSATAAEIAGRGRAQRNSWIFWMDSCWKSSIRNVFEHVDWCSDGANLIMFANESYERVLVRFRRH